MIKDLCSEDIIWYDQTVHGAITALADKYDNAIPIFGGALGAHQCIERGDFDGFVGYFPDLIHSAKFFRWHEDIVAVLRRFCHLCYVDPMLIEAYLGCTLHELVQHYQ